MRSETTGPPLLGAGARVLASRPLDVPGLQVSLVQDGAVTYLHLRGRLGPIPSLLLPIGPVQGLSLLDPLGRLHSRSWALLWGPGPVPAHVVLSTGDLRWRLEQAVAPQALGHLWVAAAEGAYRCATVDERPVALADRW